MRNEFGRRRWTGRPYWDEDMQVDWRLRVLGPKGFEIC